MTKRLAEVGISQRLRIEWLEATANLVLAGSSGGALAEALDELLAPQLSVASDAVRGSRQKTITILTKIWHTVPPGLEPLRERALALLPESDATHRHALHWGMTMAAYPFWSAVAMVTGRLLRLQGTAAAAQVQRRMRERYGERSTVARATARLLRSYVDWGVLVDAKRKGVYGQATPHSIREPGVAACLAEAAMRCQKGTVASVDGLFNRPALFPFRLPPLSAPQLASHSTALEAMRQGLNEDVLVLRPARA